MAESIELSDYVREVMALKKLSTYDVARQSDGKITAATVSKIVNKEIRSSTVETLANLANGLRVPAEDVIRVARGLPPEPSRFEIYAEAFDAELDPSEWQFLEGYFRDQVDQYVAIKDARIKQIEREVAKSKEKGKK